MDCVSCLASHSVVKNGFYRRPSDAKKIQKYRCQKCRKSFSAQRFTVDYRLRKRSLNELVFQLLTKGMSQRDCARLLGVKPETIARRLVRFGAIAEQCLKTYRETRAPAQAVMFDEMESFEHTKCKPLTIPIAVEAKTRKVLSLKVGNISAKGPLAALSRRKYGPRKCERSPCLDAVMRDLKSCSTATVLLSSDMSQHYPPKVAQWLPQAIHKTYKGRKSAVVGQGELKKGGYDPLFSLNHTYAMFRYKLSRLARRTWCTTKRKARLEQLLYIYAHAHNLYLDNIKTDLTKTLISPVLI